MHRRLIRAVQIVFAGIFGKMVERVYARMDQSDKAADYYRKFLAIAPDHKLAPKVRETLDNYEKSKK